MFADDILKQFPQKKGNDISCKLYLKEMYQACNSGPTQPEACYSQLYEEIDDMAEISSLVFREK